MLIKCDCDLYYIILYYIISNKLNKIDNLKSLIESYRLFIRDL